MKAIKVYNSINKTLNKQEKAPFKVRRLFRDTYFSIEVFGNQISFGEDFVSLEEAREGMAWIVDQLGGKVEWND